MKYFRISTAIIKKSSTSFIDIHETLAQLSFTVKRGDDIKWYVCGWSTSMKGLQLPRE